MRNEEWNYNEPVIDGEFEIEYKTLGIKVVLKASEEFSNIVLYTPRGKEYFCIENQTCSTDAKN